MKAFSSVDLYFFLIEQKEALIGSRLETFYHSDNHFILRLYMKQRGTVYFTLSLGEYLYISSSKKEAPLHPSSFISYMRKYLKNAFIDGVEQVDFERILCLDLTKKEGESIKSYKLYLELFAGGNVILCNEENVIVNSLIKKTFKDRTVRNKQHYELPPKRKLNPLSVDENTMSEVVENSELSVVKFLALEGGLGGKYAEAFCLLKSIDRNTLISSLDLSTIYSLVTLPTQLSLQPCLVTNESSYSDFYPFTPNINSYESRYTFNECLYTYYSQFEKSIQSEKENEFEKKIKSLQKRIQKQEEQKEMIFRENEELTRKGELLYEHYALVEELISSIKDAAKKKGWDHVIETVNSNPELKQYIDSIDYKNNKIILDLE